MTAIDETVQRVASAQGWNQRVAQIRLVPQRHGTAEHPAIYAGIARSLYLEHLAPDFAYVHEATFYEREHFNAAYAVASAQTQGFERVDEDTLTRLLVISPKTLLVFRTMLGLTKEEFAHSTLLAAAPLELAALSAGKIDSMERKGTATHADQARVAALTIAAVMDGTLFGEPPTGLKSKQEKPDTHEGWATVRDYARRGVPYDVFLHQRHYGGAFRQLLDATSTRRGDLIEDAVEALFREHRVPHIRTGAHNQEDIARRSKSVSPLRPISSCSTVLARYARCWSAKARITVAPRETRRCALSGCATKQSAWAACPSWLCLVASDGRV
ncbi:MAG: hypothetical protein LCH79_11750 [Proteobacteria bacterium]|nr:hypothetical protein [Pseudomonadota bacterium]